MRYVITLTAILLAGQLVAQQSTTDPTPGNPTDPSIRPATPDGRINTGVDRTFDGQKAHQMGRVMRASKIIGINVKNKDNEDLGTINDLVINPEDGRVAYAAVSMGGFLGVGDKLFAVPFEAIECREVDGKHVAMLDINKQSLANAQGFDEEHWPNMGDDRWRTDNDRPYESLRRRTHETLRPIQQPGAQQPGAQGAQPLGTQPQPTQQQ